MLKYYKKKGIQIFCSLVENSLYQCSLYRGVTVIYKSQVIYNHIT